VLALLQESEPELATRVGLHLSAEPLFQRHGIDDEITRALHPKVWLKSGGYVVIEETEALVSIDVNTGKYLGREDLEQTALRANREAAREIARQLRLRDLGGIIVIDFIDMEREESRRQIVEELEQALRRDSARTKVIGLSELGLLQLTRKRSRPALGAALTRSCPLCHGHGRIKAPRTLAAEVLSELRRTDAGAGGRYTLSVHPDTASAIGAALADDEAASTGGPRPHVRLRQDRAVRPDHFELSRRVEEAKKP
jgi:ribonuclease G